MPKCTLSERDVADIERRLQLYRENAPKRIAHELGVDKDVIYHIGLGVHAIQVRRGRRSSMLPAAGHEVANV